MIKSILTILALLMPLTALTSMAQSSDMKSWSDGKISWSDFQGIPTSDSIASYFECTLDIKSVDTKSGNGKINIARAYMNRDMSYVADSSLLNNDRLRYHQLQFDLLEVARRKLQAEINTGIGDEEQKLLYFRNSYIEQLKDIDNETDYGRNMTKLAEWEYFTQKNLEEMSIPYVPQQKPDDFSYGAYLGLGGIFPTGNIKDAFDGCFTFSAGLTGGYKRIKLSAGVSYGQPSFNNRNIYGITDNEGRDLQGALNDEASFLDFSLSLGYSVVDTRKVAITPYFGMFLGRYSWNAANYEWSIDEEGNDIRTTTSTEDKKIKDVNWTAGINFDFKLHTYTTDKPFWAGKREQLVSSLRITPYVAHAVYSEENPAIKGYYVGVTVAYSGIIQALVFK